MCLKCGQMPESTWAIDKLNVLLMDERALGYFCLSQNQSMLDSLVDHFRRCLKEVFGGVFNDMTEYEQENTLDATCVDCSHTGNGQSQCDLRQNTRTVAESTHQELPGLSGLPPPSGSCVFLDRPHSSQEAGSDHESDTATSPSHIDLDFSSRHCNFPSPKNINSSLDGTREKTSRVVSFHTIDERHPHSTNWQLQRKLHLSSLGDVRNDYTTTLVCARSDPNSPTTPQEESEVCDEEENVLWSIPPDKECLQRRCLCLANILRNLSFIPGNDSEFSKHPGLLRILGVLLLLHHVHLLKLSRKQAVEDKLQDDDISVDMEEDVETVLGPDYWWWSCLKSLRETVFVIMANISGQLDLSIHPEYVVLPLLDGLLHWTICPSTQALDHLSSQANALYLTPQRLVLEALAKLSILDTNVDYILATPPLGRFHTLYLYLVKMLGYKEQPVIRQFALVLLSNLAQGDEGASFMIGGEKLVVSHLVECLESSESMKRRKPLPQPMFEEEMSITMLRRAAVTLQCLAKVRLNRKLFTPCMDRLLYLSTSDHLDPSVSSVVVDILFELGKHQSLLS